MEEMDQMDSDPSLTHDQRVAISIKWREELSVAGLDIVTAMGVSITLISFPIRMLQTVIFSNFLKRKFTVFKASSLVEFGFSFCMVIWVYKYASMKGVAGGEHEFDKGFDQFQLFVHNAVEETNLNEFRFDILLAVHTSFLWMKVMLLFKLTRSFGPLLKIIEKMMYDFAYFCVIWGINLLFFTFLGTLLFSEIQPFSSMKDTLLMLI